MSTAVVFLIVFALTSSEFDAAWAATPDAGQLRQHAEEAFEAGDTKTGIERLTKAAEAGDVTAQVHLGWLYRLGRGVPQDFQEALAWFWAAAAQGNAGAEYSLGTMFEHGRGVPQSYEEAVRWYRSSAQKGNAQAQNNLGWLYQQGRGVPKDYEAAARWYRLAADQHQPDALGNLGYLHYYGLGMERDAEEGIRLIRDSADHGDAEAAALLSRLEREQADIERQRQQQEQARREQEQRDRERRQQQASRSYAAAAPPAPPSPQTVQPPPPPSGAEALYGQWRSVGPIVDQGLRQMYLRLAIHPDTVTFSYDCRYLDGSHLTGRFTARARVSARSIRLLQGGIGRAEDASNVCQASIRPITLSVRQAGRTLTVQFPDKTVTMRRIGG